MFTSKKITTMGGDVFRDEYSLAFDGTNDNIRIPETTYDIDGGTVSFVFWLKRAVEGVNHTILGHTSENSHKYIQINSSNDIKIESDTNNDASTITRNIEDAEWHHYVIAISSGTVTAYQDGVACSVSGTIDSNNLTINTIGGQGTGGAIYEYNGNMSEIAIYNIALTSSQAKTIYNGREPFDHKDWAKSGNLTQWWRMGDGSLDKGTESHFDQAGLVGDEVNPTLGNQVTTGWTNGSFGSVTISGLNLTNAVSDGSGNHSLYSSAIDATADEVYKVSFTISGTTGSALTYQVSGATSLNSATYTSGSLSTGDHVMYFRMTATDSTTYAGFRSSSQACDFSLTNFSLQKINGNPGLLLNMTASDFVGDRP